MSYGRDEGGWLFKIRTTRGVCDGYARNINHMIQSNFHQDSR